MKLLLKTPLAGFKDTFGRSAVLETTIASRLMSTFAAWGYTPLRLPLVERAEAFSTQVIGHSPWPEWDPHSSFLLDVADYADGYRRRDTVATALLIPEGTVSVARWLAGWLEQEAVPFPVKVSYHCTCFRNEPIDQLGSTKLRQFEQVGMEILGTNSAYSDVETLALIGVALEALGIARSSIRHRVSDMRLFNTLVAGTSMDESTRVYLKERLDGIAEWRAKGARQEAVRERELLLARLRSVGAGERLNAWAYLADTCTGEVSDLAAAPFPREILTSIEQNLFAIKRLGYSAAVADLAVVRSHEYYTGMVMEVDVVAPSAVSVEIAGGGRYDRLIGSFVDGGDTRVPAIGFAFGLQRMATMVEDAEALRHVVVVPSRETTLVIAPSGDYVADHARAEALRAAGKCVDVFAGDRTTDAEIETYALRRDARVYHELPDVLTSLFSDAYPALYFDPISEEENAREARAVVRLLGVPDGQSARILDIPCGTGRHSVQLALLGQDVVAVDRSEAFLARAEEDARRRGVDGRVSFQPGDVRWVHLPPAEFEHAICLFNSLGYYGEDEDRAFLRAIHSCIRPGGRFIVEVLNRDWVLTHYQARRWLQSSASLLLESNVFDAVTSRSWSDYTLLAEPADGRPLNRVRAGFRLYSAHELVRDLQGAGFVGVDVFGTLDGGPFDVTGSKLIVIRAAKAVPVPGGVTG